MRVEMRDAKVGEGRELSHVWLDDQEVAAGDLTLLGLLHSVDEQGWQLDRALMFPQPDGAMISYFYRK
jgi:hypothetical protein